MELDDYVSQYLSLSLDEVIDIYDSKVDLDILPNSIVDFCGGGFNAFFGRLTYVNVIKFFKSIPNVFKTKKEVVEYTIIEQYTFLKKEFCRSETVQQFIEGKILEFEFALELAKLLIQRTGEGMDIAAIVSVFIVKIGIRDFCACELSY